MTSFTTTDQPTYRHFEESCARRNRLVDKGVDALVDHLNGMPDIAQSVVESRRVEAQPAKMRPFPEGLHPALAEALKRRGWNGIYSHQAQAFEIARAGRSFVVVTPTASGKTLCYNLPIVDGLLADPAARALYLFPTKALARDQLAELTSLIEAPGRQLSADVYDGDTPKATRSNLRKSSRIILSNPDMLHAAILPNHTKWIGFFQGLRWIVIDELHQYRGVFGSHVGNVIRRLKRICAFYGADPRFICTSATIGNPSELGEMVLGEPVEVIDRSGAPAGPREIWLCSPTQVDATNNSRKNPLSLATALASEAMQAGNPTILFCRSRMEVEVALTLLRETVPGVESYRGGYLPSERRGIERRLRDGELPGVVSTNALELGIDVGNLDVAISCGYPGTLASARQQMGRAGRRSSASLSVLIAGSRPLDQYLVHHPEYFFERSPEFGLADPNNDLVRASQMRCAAFELPFQADESFGGDDTREFLEFFAEEGLLHRAGGSYHWMTAGFPARDVSLRSANDENVVIIDQGPPERVIGELDRAAAVTTLHEQAIYVHRGQQYHVDRFDYPERKAWVRKVDVEYYTQAELAVEVKVLQRDREEPQGQARANLGDVTLTIIPTVFKKLKIHGAENVGAGPINLPEERLQTVAFWLDWPGKNQSGGPGGRGVASRVPAVGSLSGVELEEALFGLAHLLRELAPLFTMCDRNDIGAAPKIKAPETGFPSLYLYDRYPGGIGLAERLYGARVEYLSAAAERLGQCDCDAGCPACVGPSLAKTTMRKPMTTRLIESLRI